MIVDCGQCVQNAGEGEHPAAPGAPPCRDRQDEAQLQELGDWDACGDSHCVHYPALHQMQFRLRSEPTERDHRRPCVGQGTGEQNCDRERVTANEQERMLEKNWQIRIAGRYVHWGALYAAPPISSPRN